MISMDAEIKCPYVDDEYECNVPLAEREIRQVRPGICPCTQNLMYVCPPKDRYDIFQAISWLQKFEKSCDL